MRSRKQRDSRELIQTPDAIELSEEELLPLLQSGDIIGGHQIARGYNHTFLIRIDVGPGKYVRAVYKPRDGERPLSDFPGGTLYKREYATFLLSHALGWPNVPLTLLREGPHGVGSIQRYVECDPKITYFDLVAEMPLEMQRFAVFDLLVNNADRKAGHCLLGKDGRVWGIDHGLTFHHIFKLRTVMVEFWGRPIPDHLVTDLKALLARLESADGLTDRLAEMLASQEVEALIKRLQAMIKDPALPSLDPYRNVPWPWV